MIGNKNLICVKSFTPSFWEANALGITVNKGDKVTSHVNRNFDSYYFEYMGRTIVLLFTEEELTNFISEREYKIAKLLK